MTQNSPRRIERAQIPATNPVGPPTKPAGPSTPRPGFTGCPRCGVLMADRSAHAAWHEKQDDAFRSVLQDLAAVRRWAKGVVADLSRLASFPAVGSDATGGDITNDGKEAGHE